MIVRSDGQAYAREFRRPLIEDHGLTLWQDLAELEGGRDSWREIELRHPDVEYVVLAVDK